MGKPTGFIEFERQTNPMRPEEERLKDWKEVYILRDEKTCETQGARCMDCGIPFCHRGEMMQGGASGCPINNLIPEWNDLIYKGRWKEALDRLHHTNNFPEFTGRVCPAPCEAGCVLSINEPAVTIHDNERAIIDKGFEMGWVIGRKGRDIAPENAIEHLFGFTIYNDFTARDTLFAEMAARLGPAKGKDFDGGNSLGPWIVTMDEIGDPHNLEMTAHINGKEFSRGNSGQAYHKIEDCIAYVSRCETLHPGEILGSGTVGTGSGIESDYWLQDGDTVALTIDKIGTLTNKVFGPSARPYAETKDTNVQIN